MPKTDNQPQADASEDRTPRAERDGILGWCGRHPKITVLFIFMVLLLGLTGSLHVAMEKRLQKRIAAIRAKGEPTTVDDLNRMRPVIPDDENMALALIEHARAALDVKIPDEKNTQLPLIGNARTKHLSGERMMPQQLEAARWYLGETQDALAGIHEALRLERGHPGTTFATPAFSTLLPWTTQYRHAQKLLALECEIAAHNGDAKRATELVAEMIHMDAALGDETTVTAALIRIAGQAMALNSLARTVNLCSSQQADLRTMQKEVERIERSIDFKRYMMAERVMYMDWTLWMRSSGSSMGATTGPAAGSGTADAWSYIPILPALDAASGLKAFTGIVDALDEPDVASLRRLKAAQGTVRSLGWYCMTKNMIANFERAVGLWIRVVGRNRSLQAALACERYRLANGRWPETLDALVPQYLATVPVDPFDGKSIRYAQTDEGIKVWTIGDDETDDGGDLHGLRREIQPRPTDYGCIFVNPNLRGRPYAGPVDEE